MTLCFPHKCTPWLSTCGSLNKRAKKRWQRPNLAFALLSKDFCPRDEALYRLCKKSLNCNINSLADPLGNQAFAQFLRRHLHK